MGIGSGSGVGESRAALGRRHLGESLELLVEYLLPRTHRIGPALRLSPRLGRSRRRSKELVEWYILYVGAKR